MRGTTGTDTLCTSNQCTWALLPPSRPQRALQCHLCDGSGDGDTEWVPSIYCLVNGISSDIVTGQGGATVCAGRGPCWRYLCNFDIFKIIVYVFKYLLDMWSTVQWSEWKTYNTEMSTSIEHRVQWNIYLSNTFQTPCKQVNTWIQTVSLYCMPVKSPPPFCSRIYDQVKHTNCLNIVTVQFYIW